MSVPERQAWQDVQTAVQRVVSPVERRPSARVLVPELNPAGLPAHVGGQHSTVSVLVLRGLVQALELAGVGRADFLRAASLEPTVLDSFDARVPREEVFRLCGDALALTGDPALGLHWAAKLTERMFGPVSPLLTNCANLEQAIATLAQYYRLFSDQADYQVFVSDDAVSMVCVATSLAPDTQRMMAEMMMGGFWQLVASFHRSARPIAVNFMHPAPPYVAEYAPMFCGAARFAQPETSLVFERALLSAPATERDDGVRAALVTLADQRLRRITQGVPYAQRVREQLLGEGWPHQTDMESVARALGCSVRSLRRRLSDENISYNDILGEALATIAKTFLRGQRHTIQEVAYEMGFSDASTFHRAFKRWTGMTPSAYREAIRLEHK